MTQGGKRGWAVVSVASRRPPLSITPGPPRRSHASLPRELREQPDGEEAEVQGTPPRCEHKVGPLASSLPATGAAIQITETLIVHRRRSADHARHHGPGGAATAPTCLREDTHHARQRRRLLSLPKSYFVSPGVPRASRPPGDKFFFLGTPPQPHEC